MLSPVVKRSPSSIAHTVRLNEVGCSADSCEAWSLRLNIVTRFTSFRIVCSGVARDARRQIKNCKTTRDIHNAANWLELVSSHVQGSIAFSAPFVSRNGDRSHHWKGCERSLNVSRLAGGMRTSSASHKTQPTNSRASIRNRHYSTLHRALFRRMTLSASVPKLSRALS